MGLFFCKKCGKECDKKYLKISFYTIFTLLSVYVLIIAINSAICVFSNFNVIFENILIFFRKLCKIFLPIIIAFIIAYVLDPLVDFFQNKYDKFFVAKIQKILNKISKKIPLKKIPFLKNLFLKSLFLKNKCYFYKNQCKKRTAGTLQVYIILLFVFSIIIGFVIMKIGNGKNGDFLQNLDDSISRMFNDLSDLVIGLRLTLAGYGALGYVSDFIDDIINKLGSSVNITDRATEAGKIIVNFFIALVISFYFLRNKIDIKTKIDEITMLFIPEKANRRIYAVFGDIHAVFSGYIRGQFIDALIMSVLFSIGLTLVGVKFSVVIGVFSGIANLIPYFGAFFAFFVSVLIAFVSGSPMTAFNAAVVIIILQQVDSIFIIPRVIGQRVELSPLTVIITLAVAGNMFGIIGMLFGIPVCAIFKIFISRFISKKTKS